MAHALRAANDAVGNRIDTAMLTGKMRRDHRPLRVRQISLVAQALAAMLRPGGRGPHDASSSVSTTCWNHSNPGHSTSFETAS